MSPDQLEMTGALGAELAANDEDETEQPDFARELARSLLALPPGLHADIPEAIYHARVLGYASKSALDELRRTPAHYRAWVSGRRSRAETQALRLGKATHCAVLEPERFARQYVLAPDFGDCRRRDNKLARDRFRDEHRAATILRDQEGATVMGMIRAAAAHPLVRSLLEGSRTEQTAIWHEAGGVPCKLRSDIHNDELLLLADIKSAEDASPAAFVRAVWQHGYHRQDDWYRRGYAALGMPVDNFVFIVLEKAPPHAVGLYELDEPAREIGRRENDALLARLARCVERDEWPAYSQNIEPLSLPRWAVKEAS